ncbi:cytidylyltransferase domain-containing protein [Hahella ganghwensis]|uniref:cytidylyltransferase domain-containing protein n=1 Tax=Hahella ganghwensis TaxID=286420 RepID=UPI0003A2B934|nr:NTP transferase domain-containing protein [Hahella ganghwensis]
MTHNKSMTGIAIVVQARMGSSRLPGKMLLPIAGKPMVDLVLARLSHCLKPEGLADHLVLATSQQPADDLLAAHVKDHWPSVRVIRGAEEDVLSRFVMAADETGADVIVRATGDCPLVNADVLPRMIESHIHSGAAVTNYRPGYEYVDKGLEVVSVSSLKQLSADKRVTKRDREHVTTMFYQHPEDYPVNYIDSEPWLRRGDLRITVDAPEDLAFFQALSEAMQTSPDQMALKQVVNFLDQHPDIVDINTGAGRKSTMHERVRVGFRCDGGATIGMGHVVGCLRMAQLLSQNLAWGIEFVCREESSVKRLVQKCGYSVEILPEDISPEADIERLLAKAKESDWSALVMNLCKRDLERYQIYFERLKSDGLRLVFMDNPLPPGWRSGDLLINALPHPDYPGYCPEEHAHCLDGLEYFLPGEYLSSLISSPSVSSLPASSKPAPIKNILIAMGGADEPDVSSLVLRGLAQAGFSGRVDIVLGAACPNVEQVKETLTATGLDGEVSVNVSDLPERMCRADLGVTAVGLTTYEMAALGLPALIVANSEFNAEVAREYCHRYPIASLIGPWNQVTEQDIAHRFREVQTGQVTWMVEQQDIPKVGSRHKDILKAFESIVFSK